MKTRTKSPRPLRRWARVLLIAAPLLISCEKDSSAQSSPVAESTEGQVVAQNSAADDKGPNKDAKKEADMKEVILNVFGMT